MSKTVFLCNPMSVDVTQLMNTLLRGTILDPADTLINIGYTNQAGAANIADGVTKLDAKINDTRGQKLVFGYSEGAQVATKWIRDHNADSDVPAADLSFLLIGNAERKYGGMIHGLDGFDAIADTAGLPSATVRWPVTDLARQYDGWADFPTEPTIRDVLADASSIGDGNDAYVQIMRDVGKALNNNAAWTSVMNIVAGMEYVHSMYFDVAVDDPNNVSYVDPAQPNVRYIWAPTYPVPLLGTGTTFPQEDRRFRTLIETCYQRPVQIPLPDYPHTSWLSVSVPWSKPAVTGWWAEIHTGFTLGVTVALGMSQYVPTQMAVDVTPSVGMDGAGASVASFGLTLDPSLSMVSTASAMAVFGLAVTASVGMAAAGTSSGEFGLSLSPELGMSGGVRYAAEFGLSLSPEVGMSATAGAVASFELSVSPQISWGQPQTTVTVDHAMVGADLTDFPMYVDLSDMSADFWSKVSASGGDIRCYAGGVELAREVVSCDVGAQTGELWVKADLSSSADTTITIDVDGQRADYAPTGPFGRNAVWSNGYAGVWHMGDDLTDSTGSGLDGVAGAASGSLPTTVSGQVGDGQSFSGTNYVSVTVPSPGITFDGATFEVFMSGHASPYAGLLYARGNGAWGLGFGPVSPQRVGYTWNDSSPSTYGWSGGELIPVDEPALVALTLSSEVATSYIGAAGSVGSSTNAFAPVSQTVSGTLRIGYDVNGGMTGVISEARMSTVARTPEWIAAEYVNQNDPASFYAVQGGGGPQVTYARDFTLAVTPSIIMAPAGRAEAEFVLDVTPDVSMDGAGTSLADFAIEVTPTMDVSATGTSAGVFELDVLPSFGMDGAGVSVAGFSLELAPEFDMIGTEHYAETFALALTPGFGMGAATNIAASMELDVPASIGMDGGEHYAADFGLSVVPSLSMTGVGTSSAAFSLTVTSALGMGGAGDSIASFGLALTPSLSMAGVGTDGVTFTPTLVSVTTPGSFSVPCPAGATKVDRVLCGGGGGGSDGAGGAAGGNTTATISGVGTLTASGGARGASATPSVGGSPGSETFNDQIYMGGTGGTMGSGFNGMGGIGTAPGGGGGGSNSTLFKAAGGSAGSWNADTVTIPSGVTQITGTVGAGGIGNGNDTGGGGNDGAHGIAHFYFHL